MRGFKQEGGGTSSSVMTDYIVEIAKVKSSSISESDSGAVLLNIAGVPGFNIDGNSVTATQDDADGSGNEGAEHFQSLGMVGRPLPPRVAQGVNQFAEAVCLKLSDGLVPISFRDLRLKMQGGSAPGEGVLAFVGYGGAFHSMTPVEAGSDPAGGGTISIVYCPYDFDSDGVAQKAHTIILDPTPDNESITIAHAEGMAITMFDGGKKELTLKNASGDTSLVLDDDGLKIQGNQIVLNAPKVIIGSPVTAIPMTPGPSSPPCSMLFLSPAFAPL